MLLNAIVAAHVLTGFVGLLAFWVPLFARKGGPLHVQAGRVYEYCAYVVAISSVLAPAMRMIGHHLAGRTFAERPDLYAFPIFLAYLGLVTLATVRHAVRVNQTRGRPEELRTRFHVALSWVPYAGALAIGALALAAQSPESPVLLSLTPVGVVYGWAIRRDVRAPQVTLPHRGWFFSHMTAMLLGGIAFHSAFIVQQSFKYDLPGFPAIVIWNRYYRRRFEARSA